MTTGSIITYSIVGLLLIGAMIIQFIETKKTERSKESKNDSTCANTLYHIKFNPHHLWFVSITLLTT